MENKINLHEHYTKWNEIDAKIRIGINELVTMFGVEIDSTKNEILNVTNINVYLDRLEDQYEAAKEVFKEKMLQDYSIWGYLAERILGCTRDKQGNRSNYTLAFENRIVSYNFYLKEE